MQIDSAVVIVVLNNRNHHQVALTKDEAMAVIRFIAQMKGHVPILETVIKGVEIVSNDTKNRNRNEDTTQSESGALRKTSTGRRSP